MIRFAPAAPAACVPGPLLHVMSWFSQQWHRWNPAAQTTDVEWVDVVWGQQRYQVALPSLDEPLTLRHLRQELASVFSIPAERVVVVWQGMRLRDDRVSLQDYGITTGSRIHVLARDAPSSQPAPPPAPHEAAAPPTPGASEEAQHWQTIEQVAHTCRAELGYELARFEDTIRALPDAPPGTHQSAPPEDTMTTPDAIPCQRIPYAQRKLSELLLRELLRLDGIPTDKDDIRTARKATVKEIQAYLDRVDAAWDTAQHDKGIVSDV